MNELAQRIAIAELQGWVREFIHGNGVDDYLWVDPQKVKAWPDTPESLPDYLNDRNAMIAAVLTLDKDQKKVFGRELANSISDLLDGYELYPQDVFDIVTAPLDKIAKAYLVATTD